jgi:hypothetical protein
MIKDTKNRKECKSCPWTNKNPHSESWKKYVDKMTSVGKINKKHSCHMITSDVWGLKSEINEENVCVGSKRKNND